MACDETALNGALFALGADRWRQCELGGLLSSHRCGELQALFFGGFWTHTTSVSLWPHLRRFSLIFIRFCLLLLLLR